jgi:hypothetical protein
MKQLSLILILIPSLLFGQEWEMIYEDGKGNCVRQCIDGGYVVTGSIFGTNTIEDVLLLKTDENGDVQWINGYGRFLPETGFSVKQTTDTGFIICGVTPWYQDLFEVYLIKTDENGDTLWTKQHGGEGIQVGSSVIQNTDGGYVITGSSEIDYNQDIYLLKTDEYGDTLWTKQYGDPILSDGGSSIQQIVGGGYIVAGSTGSDGAGWDVYLMKTDENGDTLWGKKFGSPTVHEKGLSVQQTTDGGFIISGFSVAYSGDTSDVFLLKTNNDGRTKWTKTYSRNKYNIGNSVQQTTDGGYIIAGGSFGPGSPSGLYLIKTDENGDTLWTRVYENCSNSGNSVQQTSDGGYIITGSTGSSSDISIYLLKTDEYGLITSTSEILVPKPNRKLLKSVDLSGREITNPKPNQPYIEIYDDGTTQKKMKLK